MRKDSHLLNFPKKKIANIDLGRSTSRNSRSFYKVMENCPDYQPKYEYTKKKLSTHIMGFDKLSPRKDQTKRSVTSGETYFDYDKALRSDRGQLFERKPSVYFERMLPRESNSNNPLPSFMQKTLNSRFSIGNIGQKTMEINGFSDNIIALQAQNHSRNTTSQGFKTYRSTSVYTNY